MYSIEEKTMNPNFFFGELPTLPRAEQLGRSERAYARNKGRKRQYYSRSSRHGGSSRGNTRRQQQRRTRCVLHEVNFSQTFEPATGVTVDTVKTL
jgi:hypothetical protein